MFGCYPSLTRWRFPRKKEFFFSAVLVLWLLPLTVSGQTLLDINGNFKYSLYNFTDAVIPYYGLDSWMLAKGTYWLDEGKTWAPYVTLLGAYMNYLPFEPREDIRALFAWQRFIEGGLGLQWYPFYRDGDDYTPVFGLRVFAHYVLREYDDPNEVENLPYSDLISYDFQGGVDYYHDNIFNDHPWVVIAWANATYRSTNFNFEDFNTFFFSTNLKIGYKGELDTGNRAIFFPYLSLDATWVPFCKSCNWWENNLHPGLGLRWYPFAYDRDGEPNVAFLRRLHLFTEVFHEGIWLKDQAPERVKPIDYRFGIGFSTPGFSRRNQEEEKKGIH